jgi:cysteine sulfinate desulfinase/cysteine desulfurase-like protein
MRIAKLLFGLTAAMALMGFGSIDSASATETTYEVGGIAQNQKITFTASASGAQAWVIKDEFTTTIDTCTSSHIHVTTEGPFTATFVNGVFTSLVPASCTHTTTVLKKGKLSVTWLSGTTNGTLTSSEAEITLQSTFFGASAVCKTGAGTDVGVITGVKSGNATIHTNAKISCGILGSSSWTGTYSVSSPSGLGIVG